MEIHPAKSGPDYSDGPAGTKPWFLLARLNPSDTPNCTNLFFCNGLRRFSPFGNYRNNIACSG